MTDYGFITLHRKIKDSAIYSDSQAVHLWVHLLLKANHKDNEFVHNGKLVNVKRGQMITGRDKLAAETGINSSKIQRLLKLFQDMQMIEQQTNSKNRLISITNYHLYQSGEQQMNSKRTTNEQQVNTNNNDKQCNNNDNNEYIPFDDFWMNYPRKTDKAKAKAKWENMKVTDETYQKIVNHCTVAYQDTDKQYIPHATTYLNGKRWEDEIVIKPIQQNKLSRGEQLEQQARELFGTHKPDNKPIHQNGGFIRGEVVLEHKK